MFFGGFPGFSNHQNQQNTQEQQEQAEVNKTQYYQILQITKEATTEQIKKAFRKKAIKQHPDKGGDPIKFQKLKDAYDTLLDPQKRQLYDDYGQQGVKNGGPPGGSGNIFDFFKQGHQDNRPKKMKPKLIKLEVTLEQVYNGVVKQITVSRYRVCSDCNGQGGANVQKCSACKGNGSTIKMTQVGPGMFSQVQVPCTTCNSRGEIFKQQDRCKFCQGKKVKQQEKTLQVVVEPGVPDSHDYIFHGESDQLPGVQSGDVYARIVIIKHEKYERKGADLVIVKQINLLQAFTGVTIQLEHLSGKKFTIATAPGEILSNKQWKTVKKLGMPFYKDQMSYGNLYIDFRVKFPSSGSINLDQQKVLRKAFECENKSTQLKQKLNIVQMSQFSQDLLNPQAGRQKQQQDQEQGHGQRVNCQQQ